MNVLNVTIVAFSGLMKPRKFVLSILIFFFGIAATYGDSILKLALNKELFDYMVSGSATTQQLVGVPIVILSILAAKGLCAWAAGMLLITRYKRFGDLPFPSRSEGKK